MKYTLIFVLAACWLVGFGFIRGNHPTALGRVANAVKPVTDDTPPRRVVKTNAEWKKILTPDQYAILREHGTERAGTSPLVDEHEHGVFYCAACHNPLFSSETKFESGTGWPSFYAPITKNAVRESSDKSYGMIRTELVCSVCDGHLGHVFNDGPKPTGLRYCMNGVALKFEKK